MATQFDRHRQRKLPGAGILFFLALGWGTGVAAADPVTENFDAQGEFIQNLTISQNTQLDFGRIQAPTSGTQDFSVLATGGTAIDSSPGGSGGVFIDGQITGQVTIAGEDGETFSITASPVECSTVSGNFAVEAFMTEVLLDSTGGTLVGGSDVVNVGGTLRIPSTTSGSGTCGYRVTADYQ